MPRRPAEILKEVPLYLIPPMIREEIKKAGEELVRIVVKKSSRHFYNISVHTRSLKRELRAGVMRAGTPGPNGVAS